MNDPSSSSSSTISFLCESYLIHYYYLSWAQVASEDLRQQRSKQDEALFEERKKHQADLNMVKESNASLR